MSQKYDELIGKYPKLYSNLSYFECNDGWYYLIESLSQILEEYNNSCKNKKDYIVAAQVKEKFGGLRFYVDSYSENNMDVKSSLLNIIENYEQMSYTICEICGKSGQKFNGIYNRTLCEEHSKRG